MSEPSNATKHRLWDVPTRAFHWTLVALLLLQFGTAEWDWLSMDWHARFGYATLALLLFRIVWGFIGSENARFSHFLRGPAATIAYAKRLLARTPDHLPGHNPLGGWGVVALLVSLLVQAVTGLFASDDVMDGPLVRMVTTDVVHFMTDVHEGNRNVLLALVAVHLLGVSWHLAVKRENLIGAMVSGRASLPTDPRLRFTSGARALVLLIVCSAVVYAIVEWLPRLR